MYCCCVEWYYWKLLNFEGLVKGKGLLVLFGDGYWGYFDFDCWYF